MNNPVFLSVDGFIWCNFDAIEDKANLDVNFQNFALLMTLKEVLKVLVVYPL